LRWSVIFMLNIVQLSAGEVVCWRREGIFDLQKRKMKFYFGCIIRTVGCFKLC